MVAAKKKKWSKWFTFVRGCHTYFHLVLFKQILFIVDKTYLLLTHIGPQKNRYTYIYLCPLINACYCTLFTAFSKFEKGLLHAKLKYHNKRPFVYYVSTF